MYVNIDAVTIRPAEHGEVFVGEDGIEADQDLGNYERFTDQTCTRENYLTTGQIYAEVIRRERNLEYGGEDVEVYPDIPKEIIRRIEQCQKKNKSEITIIEYGGTVGEYQLLPFLEATRMMKAKKNGDVFVVLISYLPVPSLLGEQKSKPTQRAIIDLHSAGLNPDFVLCRSELPASPDIKQTISNVCSIPVERIVSAPDVYSIYDVPVNFEKEDMGRTLLKTIGLPVHEKDLKEWTELANKIKTINQDVTIGIVGKYFNFKSCKDTYISVIESINHASWSVNRKAKILWLDSERYETDLSKLKELDGVDGIIVPGGWGHRGVEGKILAVQYAREHDIPYLGLCYGLQMAVIEFARNVLKLKGANTMEVNPKTQYPVVHTIAEQVEKIKQKNMGATSRLGTYDCKLKKGTLAQKLYGTDDISERHRHRYEVNEEYVPSLEKAGMAMAGRNPQQNLVEIIEIPANKFFIGVQFHPEFKSRPLHPHPIFLGFIKAAIKQ